MDGKEALGSSGNAGMSRVLGRDANKPLAAFLIGLACASMSTIWAGVGAGVAGKALGGAGLHQSGTACPGKHPMMRQRLADQASITICRDGTLACATGLACENPDIRADACTSPAMRSRSEGIVLASKLSSSSRSVTTSGQSEGASIDHDSTRTAP